MEPAEPPLEPLLLDLPEAIETPRLRLVIPRAGDGAEVTASVRASLPELKQWMPWAHDGYADRDGEVWCRRAVAEFHAREQLQFMLRDRAGGRHVGNVGAFKFDWKVRSCEIGYWLRTDAVGRGFMTEAVAALVSTLQERAGIRRVEIRCDDRNVRSALVAERCGFAREGLFHADSLDCAGQPRDTRVYALVRRA
jgi:RimJ/RimL family protein N-acetyltransferase